MPDKMSEKSVWVKLNKHQMGIKAHVLKALGENFAVKKQQKRPDESVGAKAGGAAKKDKELRILDSKSNQNLSIALRGQYKHMTYEDIQMAILQVRCSHNLYSSN